MINKNSAMSFYHQLMDILIDEIKEKLNPNEKMMSEREICKKYDISRTTVRLALQELENMGYIYKRSGKGTFVAELMQNGKKNLMDHYSFTDQMRLLGKVPQTKVLKFEIVNSYKDIAEKLGLNSGDEVYYLKRLRLADGVPMMVETSYIPVENFKGLEEHIVAKRPLYEIFREDYNEEVKTADEAFSASLINDKEATLLEVKKGSACLRLTRMAFNKKNRVIELTLSTARSDQFIYKVQHRIS